MLAIFGEFVRNSGRVFAILLFAVLGRGGGVKGHQNGVQTFCEQIGVSYFSVFKSFLVKIIEGTDLEIFLE